MASAVWAQRPPLPTAAARRHSVQGRAAHLAVRAAQQLPLDCGCVAFVPDRVRPRAVLHFLGGAFVAATPHLVYPLLLSRLADAGYTTICTPYAVTFDHVGCARRTLAAFDAALAELRASSGWAVPPHGAPVIGVGHSNGSLLHALIGAVCLPEAAAAAGSSSSGASGSSNGHGGPASSGAGERAGAILMSFNNLQVAEAVPIPLGLVGPVVQQLRGGGRLREAAEQGLGQAAGAARQLLALGAAAGAGGGQAAELLAGLQQWDPALLQLGDVFDEVGDGSTDFFPPPAEARRLVAAGYRLPATLLVQFSDDNTDETPELEGILRGALGADSGREVTRLLLPGTHVTPCGAGWRVGPGAPFGPGDVLAAAAATVLQADTRRLADRLVAWLDVHC